MKQTLVTSFRIIPKAQKEFNQNIGILQTKNFIVLNGLVENFNKAMKDENLRTALYKQFFQKKEL